MRFYKDIIDRIGKTTEDLQYHYHVWSPYSIKYYWNICTKNPFIRRQFYPIEYWEDLLSWTSNKIINKPLKIVDIGCGNGNMIECLRQVYRNETIYGIDISEESLEFAKERYKNDRNIRFRIGSLEKIPLDDCSVDLITCTEVLEHTFPKIFHKSFSEISRVLKKGGYYLATVPFLEEINLVCCPECGSVFTPYQHMMFEITHNDIEEILSKNNFKLIDFYQSLDRSQPKSLLKRICKPIIIRCFPRFAKRIFPRAGVSGFLATKKG